MKRKRRKKRELIASGRPSTRMSWQVRMRVCPSRGDPSRGTRERTCPGVDRDEPLHIIQVFRVEERPEAAMC
jgi:hypothetical protein